MSITLNFYGDKSKYYKVPYSQSQWWNSSVPPDGYFYCKADPRTGGAIVTDCEPGRTYYFSHPQAITKEEYMAAHAAPTKASSVPNPRIEVWPGIDGKWYWHERAINGQVTRTGGQAFKRKWNAKRAAKKAQGSNFNLPIVVLEPGELDRIMADRMKQQAADRKAKKNKKAEGQ